MKNTSLSVHPRTLAMGLVLMSCGCGWFGSDTVRVAPGEGPVDDIVSLLKKPNTDLKPVLAESCSGLACFTGNKADIAIAFSHDDEREDVRTLVPLYEHYLFIVAGPGRQVDGIRSMKGRRIGAGPKDSGTNTLFRLLLRHYGFEPDSDMPVMDAREFEWRTGKGETRKSKVECRGSETTPIVCTGEFRALRMAFVSGWIDVYSLLGATDSRGVKKALEVPGSTLVSLDSDPDLALSAMEGIHSSQPSLVGRVLPRHLFEDKPAEPVGVIGSQALLVARSGFDRQEAWKVTRAIFEYKHTLSERNHMMRNVSERFDANDLAYPLHSGADMYYRRDEPTFVQKWAEPFGVGLAVMTGLWSGMMALWARRRRKKRDVLGRLYEDFHQIIGQYDEKHETPLDRMTEKNLVDIRDRLIDLRRKAFQAALSGETEMSQRFTVFQDFLLFEMGSVERMLRKKRESANG